MFSKNKELKIKNSFTNMSVRGFYNPSNIYIGFVYKTPTGRNSKIFTVARIPTKECTQEDIDRYSSREYITDRLKDIKNPRQQLVHVVASEGLGTNPVYILKTYAI